MTDVGFGCELTADINKDGMSEEQRQMYIEMAQLFADRFETFVQKNLDYGSSFLSAGEIDQVLGDGPFDSAEEANLYKLFTRIQDKDQRFYNLVFGDGTDHVDEAAAETAGDAAVYWLMANWLLEYHDEKKEQPRPPNLSNDDNDSHGQGLAVDERGEVA